MLRTLLGAAALSVAACGAAQAAVSLSNGILTGTVDEATGTFDVTLNGADFFSPGTPVADFGFQVGNDTSTFRSNTLGGGVGLTNTSFTISGPRKVVYKATFAPNSTTNIRLTRTITLVEGLDVFRIDTSLKNNKSTSSNIRYFEAYDPDNGSDSSTENDLQTIGGIRAGTASNPFGSVAIGGAGFRTGFASGLGIFSGSDLNSFFSSSLVDPGNSTSDIGIDLGRDLTLGGKRSTSFRSTLAFGFFEQDAVGGFDISYGNVPARVAAGQIATPIPAALPLMGAGLVGLGALRWRRKRAPAA